MDEQAQGCFAWGKLRLPFGSDIGRIMTAQRPGPAAEIGIVPLRVAQRKFLSRFKISPLRLVWNTMQHAEHRVVFTENAANRGGGVNPQWLKFAQQKQAEDVVEIGAGQHHTCDRRLADAVVRMQLRRGFNLSAQVRRRAEKKPRASVFCDCNLGLAAW